MNAEFCTFLSLGISNLEFPALSGRIVKGVEPFQVPLESLNSTSKLRKGDDAANMVVPAIQLRDFRDRTQPFYDISFAPEVSNVNPLSFGRGRTLDPYELQTTIVVHFGI